VLGILIRKQEIMRNGQFQEPKLVLSCVSSNEMRSNSKVIDPILDEMYMIHFQPFYDFGREVGGDWTTAVQNQLPRRKRHPFNLEGELMTTMVTSPLQANRRLTLQDDWKSPLRVGFKKWDERLLNHIVDTPCMRFYTINNRSVNHV